MAARDGLLAWLYEVTLKGNRAPAIADFRNSTYGGYYGREFTENEIEDATRWLLDQGFITGTPTFGGGVARPSISPLGERVAESGQPISGLSATPANVTTINVEGSLMQEDRTAGPIFVVHGRDHTVLHHAVRVLQQGTGREVIVLHEKPNAGRTILEKFEHHAGPTSYAVILLTGDDEGGPPGDPARSRGRQNVVFELGFFFGRLGRQKVAVLLGKDVEKPSDIDGLVYIGLDPGGAWKHLLCRELAAAGIEVNYSKIP
jgi:predicted nucleotide-binding protein